MVDLGVDSSMRGLGAQLPSLVQAHNKFWVTAKSACTVTAKRLIKFGSGFVYITQFHYNMHVATACNSVCPVFAFPMTNTYLTMTHSAIVKAKHIFIMDENIMII